MPSPVGGEVTNRSSPGWSSSTRASDRVEVVGQVGLGEHEHRVGAGIPGQGLAALDAPGGDGPVEAAGEEHEVDVGGQELDVVATRGPPPQQRGPIEQRQHVLAVERQPVADGHRLDPAAQLHHAVARRRADLHGHPVVAQHAAGLRGRPVLRRAAPTSGPRTRWR